MDLWIRSQDKMELRPNPKLAIEVIQGSYYVTDRYEFDKSNILGIYKTKERALEVLDEIQRFVIVRAEFRGTHEEQYLQMKAFELANKTKIFEMPKE